ncbi:V-type proton ATPase 16 kDa proteolipid subunit-like [Panicum virgatum]|nr:V-type proton ATPase 16 kDa proteolipid subunit-like [Panicum virgatum]
MGPSQGRVGPFPSQCPGSRRTVRPLPGRRGKIVHITNLPIPPPLATPWPSRLLPHPTPELLRSDRRKPKSQAEERNLERSCRRRPREGGRGTRAPQASVSLRSTSGIGVSSGSKREMSAFSGDETAPFFGFLGAAAALIFSCMGAAYGTAKSGVGVASMGVMRPELVMKSIVPVVMAGVLGIYGLIIAVIISTGINPKAKPYYLFDGYAHLSSGLACGLAGLAAGMAIGIVGDAGVRANAQQPKLFVGMILILIFAEALALYGLIVGIILSSRAGQSRAD